MIDIDQPQSPSYIANMELSELKLKLYVDLIQSLALENPSFPVRCHGRTNFGYQMAEISRLSDLSSSGTENVDSDPSESSRPAICGALRETELLTFGMAPVRHHTANVGRNPGHSSSIAEFFRGEIIQKYKIGLEDKKQEASLSSHRVAELMDRINQTREDLDPFPHSNRVERALYNHQPQTNITLDEDVNIAKAIEAAYSSLKKDEKEMKMQNQSLDRQLQEYESLMQLQIINDWTKVQQETDECLKDLRRLGWTGD
ncbi:hypothetical protein BJ912DRAFT_944203 [Pholiota molesta]|nr:hypothetical protein BJ912DRAFT_944203 [Pholiota molesta]